MNHLKSNINSLFNLFTQDTRALEQIVKEYPASSLARILLAKKYKEEENSLFQDFKEEAACYMGNVPWYLFVLSQADNGINGTAVLKEKPQEIVSPEVKTEEREDIVVPADSITEEPPVETASNEELITTEVSEDIPRDTNGGEEVIVSTYDEHEFQPDSNEDDGSGVEKEPDVQVNVEETVTASESEEVITKDDEQSEVFSNEIEAEQKANENVEAQDIDSDENKSFSSEDELVHARDESDHIESEPVIDSEIETEEETKRVEGEDISTEQIVVRNQEGDIDSIGEEATISSADDAVPGETEQPVESEESFNKETARQEVHEGKSGNEIEFEPLHTIDYFASQGIKLREEDLKDDRLSQQVKSFTGWLKSMKQLHPGRLPEQNEVIEKIIQNAAETSNVGPDVLTEAMAEVLVKQNKKDKAVEMYQKLSLINPSKSAYFAAKIENLKTS